MTKNNTALLVLSCDSYSDLWPIFIQEFEKNWPDCPLDKFFVTNYLDIPESSFSAIKIGQDNSWTHGLTCALKSLRMRYSHVLLTLEDLPIVSKVNTQLFNLLLNEFFTSNGNYLKFIRKPKPTHKHNEHFGIVSKGSLYRPTCVYALWNIETLLALLNENENAWQFERFGAVRSDSFDGFYVVYKDFFNVLNTVVKGKWVPTELNRLRKMGHTIPLTRPVLSKFQSWQLKINRILFTCFTTFVPWQWRRAIVFKVKKYDR